MKTLLLLVVGMPLGASAQSITVDAADVIGNISPLIYGVGAEDVNHEIYGGLYDQRIFGEGFEEPAEAGIVDFRGYEIAIDASTKEFVLGKHDHNWQKSSNRQITHDAAKEILVTRGNGNVPRN